MHLSSTPMTPYAGRGSGKGSQQRDKSAVREKSAHLNVQCRWSHQRCQSASSAVSTLLVLSCGQVCQAAVLLTSLSNFMRRRGGFARNTDRLLLPKSYVICNPLPLLYCVCANLCCRCGVETFVGTLLSCPK